MPKLEKGTECLKLPLSQASKEMHQPLVPMLFPILDAYMSETEFLYPDQNWTEPCGMIVVLVFVIADSVRNLYSQATRSR